MPIKIAPRPFYGMEFVPPANLSTVKGLQINVVLWAFPHDGSAETWRAYLDEAEKYDIKVIGRLWPEGWHWDGTSWQIDDQARSFIQTLAQHPATFAVYALEEPFWQGCWGCGYTTSQLQMLYATIKSIANVPVYSEVGSISFWSEQGEKTAFSDGVCDYCANWDYPFHANGSFSKEELKNRLSADRAIARERAPKSKFVWLMQSFAQNGTFRMPSPEEMRDLASVVFAEEVDGVLWYCWNFGPIYSDFLSNHPELYPVVKEIYEKQVVSK